MSIQRIGVAVLIAAVTIGGTLGLMPGESRADFDVSGAAGGLTKSPYGGRVLIAWPCTCNTDGAFWLVIGPPGNGSGVYLYKPLSVRLYPRRMPVAVGRFHLGWRQLETSDESGCSMYVGEDCVDWYYTYVITAIGTS